MNKTITRNDLELINNLSSRVYTGNKMTSNASNLEIEKFKEIKIKLKEIAEEFKNKYQNEYGNLEVSISTGNPIAYGGKHLNKVWAGIYKGASNKQYSGQISFILSPKKPCLEIGFYFGNASAHSLKIDERIELEKRLNFLGKSLSGRILNDFDLNRKYESLFDYGFIANFNGKRVISNEWVDNVKVDPKGANIIYQIFPNEDGYIENTTINLYVSLIIFLMSLIPSSGSTINLNKRKPLTIEQRAKQAERRTLIGLKGEKFVLKQEEEKLKNLNINTSKYLKHVSLESDSYGYDILSCDFQKNKIFIEVKSTTRMKDDPNSKKFFLSRNEYDFYQSNKSRFKLYRVYNVEGDNPEIEIINMESVQIKVETYLIEIN